MVLHLLTKRKESVRFVGADACRLLAGLVSGEVIGVPGRGVMVMLWSDNPGDLEMLKAAAECGLSRLEAGGEMSGYRA